MKNNSEYPLKLVNRLKVDLDKADILNVRNESLSPWSLPSYRGFHIQQIDENTNKTLDILKLLSNSNRRLVITIKASDSISRTTVATRKTYRTNEITMLKET